MLNSSGLPNWLVVLARLLVLTMLFGSGLALMWHIGQIVVPKPRLTASGAPRYRDALAAQHSAARASLAPGLDSPRAAKAKQDSSPAPVSESEPAGEARASGADNPGAKGSASLPINENKQAAKKMIAPSEKDGVTGSDLLTYQGVGEGVPHIVSGPGWKRIVTEPILFNTGVSEIRESSLNQLDGLANVLKKHTDIRLSIIGHTDNLGSEEANQTISVARAQAVREYLVSKGVEASRLEAKGMGSKGPIASNETQFGRQANRRIEFLVIGPD